MTWWQAPAPALVASGDAPFNHGERLYATGTSHGELDAAAKLLGSTKAMVFLTTNHELRTRAAPTFVAVQLVVASDGLGDRLDCIGYFRKQDLTLGVAGQCRRTPRDPERVLDLGPSGPCVPAIWSRSRPRRSTTT